MSKLESTHDVLGLDREPEKLEGQRGSRVGDLEDFMWRTPEKKRNNPRSPAITTK